MKKVDISHHTYQNIKSNTRRSLSKIKKSQNNTAICSHIQKKSKISSSRVISCFVSSLIRGTKGLQSAKNKIKILNLKELVLSWQQTSTSWKRQLPLLSLVRKSEPLLNQALAYCFLLFRFYGGSNAYDCRFSCMLLIRGEFRKSRWLFCDEFPELLRWKHTNALA